MKLPSMAYSNGMASATQTSFAGLNHTPGAGDGELYHMENLTGAYYPLLSSRPPRWKVGTLTQPGGLFAHTELCWVDEKGFWYNGERKGDVTAGEKQFAALGAYLLIWPDKAYYNTQTGVLGSLEARWAGQGVSFQNGTLYEQEAQASTIQAAGVHWADHFQKGDAVTISGCVLHPENNKTIIIRDIQGDKLVFYEYSFALEGEKGDQPYTESGEVTIARTLPDLDFVCENENRVWGCKGNTIYCSKLGDPFNWNVFDGLATDAYAVDTGSAGEFTGCVSYLGYPIFFKEDHIYKVYGTIPSNFQVMGTSTLGVAQGCGKSLAVAGEVLFYVSRAGVMAYSGGVPQCISRGLGSQRLYRAAAGADGLRYHLSAQDEDGNWHLLVYDTQTKLWHREDDTQATHFAAHGGSLYLLSQGGEIWTVGDVAQPPEGAKQEGQVAWVAEFADFTDGSPDKKGLFRLHIRLEVAEGGQVQAWAQVDSDGVWHPMGQPIGPTPKRSFQLPMVIRRGDHYRIKLTGTGACRIYSITRERYGGSAYNATPGRT